MNSNRTAGIWDEKTLTIAIVAAVFAVFGGVLNNGLLVFDDTLYLGPSSIAVQYWNGATTFDLVTEVKYFYHPVTQLTHALCYGVFGQSPFGHHLVNLVLHIMSTVLLFWIGRNVVSNELAAIGALLWAVLPINVESTSWVAERKGLLATFFVLLGFYSAVLLRKSPPRESRVAIVAGMVAAFLCSFLSKPSGILLWPIALLLIEDRLSPRMRVCSVSILSIGTAATLVLTIAAGLDARTLTSIQSIGLWDRLVISVENVSRFARLTIVPSGHSCLYHLNSRGRDCHFVVGCVLIALWSYCILLCRDSICRLLLLWLPLAIIPVCGLLHIGDHVFADRYCGLPAVGIVLLILVYISKFDSTHPHFRSNRIAVCGLAVIASTMSFYSYNLVKTWGSDRTLFRTAIAVDPRNQVAYNNLAVTYMNEGKYDIAEGLLRSACIGDRAYAEAYLNLGILYLRRGLNQESIRLLEEALSRRDDALTRINLAYVYLTFAHPSRIQLRRAFALASSAASDPGGEDVRAYSTLAYVNATYSKGPEAMQCMANAYRISLGQTREAQEQFRHWRQQGFKMSRPPSLD